MLLEICANSYQSAKNAQEAKAHRIELCNELSVGGITPSPGLIQKVRSDLNIETFVLIRPRSGDFYYTEDEFEIMKHNIQYCKTLGCHGIVSGILNSDNTIDIERTRTLIELSKPLHFTFHRAFDVVPNPKTALETLINLGVNCILTSGQQDKAIDGIELLKDLHQKARGRITILPGSGINAKNSFIFKQNGFEAIHSSASEVISKGASNYFGNIPKTISSIENITNILKVINHED